MYLGVVGRDEQRAGVRPQEAADLDLHLSFFQGFMCPCERLFITRAFPMLFCVCVHAACGDGVQTARPVTHTHTDHTHTIYAANQSIRTNGPTHPLRLLRLGDGLQRGLAAREPAGHHLFMYVFVPCV